jgi:acetyltransferase-like isoleucine patch superfamily enzyme
MHNPYLSLVHFVNRKVMSRLRKDKLVKYNRHVSLGDLFFDRDETAKFLGFGAGSTCYNNVLVIGDVKVGKNSWIGPNVVLDGSGELVIGDHVSISAGVQIYSHHTVEKSNSLGVKPIKIGKTVIGDGVYIGPNSIVQLGVTIGNSSIIGALSFVNRDIPPNVKAYGSPVTFYEDN